MTQKKFWEHILLVWEWNAKVLPTLYLTQKEKGKHNPSNVEENWYLYPTLRYLCRKWTEDWRWRNSSMLHSITFHLPGVAFCQYNQRMVLQRLPFTTWWWDSRHLIQPCLEEMPGILETQIITSGNNITICTHRINIFQPLGLQTWWWKTWRSLNQRILEVWQSCLQGWKWNFSGREWVNWKWSLGVNLGKMIIISLLVFEWGRQVK